MFRHEKYEVWQKSVDFVLGVTAVSGKFPEHEKYGLTSQVRRAAFSIPSNIAEGCGRNSDPDFSRFLGIAYGSLMEVMTCVTIAHRLKYLDQDGFSMLRRDGEQIARMLSGLRTRLKGRKALSPKL